MTGRAPATFADLLMGLGLLPVALCYVVVVIQLLTAGIRHADLTIIMIAGVIGTISYLVACFVSGASAIWAIRKARAAGLRPSRLTVALASTTAIVMVIPWALFALRQAF